MKYKIIKDNHKFRLLNSKKFIYYDAFPNPNDTMSKNKTIKTSRGVISTKILTDGQIKSVTDLDSIEFVLPTYFRNAGADVEEVKDLELINYNYVIRILTQLEYKEFNRDKGLFEIIKDIEVYIRDKKDKETLRNIKKTLNLIYGPKDRPNDQGIEYQKAEFGVYQLVK
jgi:hypothetical protein